MKTTYLCPVYWKWLQRNPEHARMHFVQTSQSALEMAKSGEMETACQAAGEAYEIAQAVLLSLQTPDTKTKSQRQDITAYGAAAIQLARTFAAAGNISQSVITLDGACQQIYALAPLYAAEPEMLSLLQQVTDFIQEGLAFYQRQTMTSRVLH